jgi:hypothetical protein
MFQNYGNGEVVMPGMQPKTVAQALLGLAAVAGLTTGLLYTLNKRKSA